MAGHRTDRTDEDRSAARRAFIRTHHPDRGGDPEVFMTGLAAFDTHPPDPEPVRVFAVPDRGWPTRIMLRWQRRRRPARVR